MTQFKREARYIVIKISDLADARLTDEQIDAFNDVCDQVARARNANGKPPLQCVVVESDWPEYEPTWAAIEGRVTGYDCTHSTRPPNPPTPPGWKPHCTQDLFRQEIEALGEIVDDIGKIASNIKAGIIDCNSLSHLEKKGVESLIAEMYERLEKYTDLHNDVVNFKLDAS